MDREKKKKDDLDTETTFADMNVEGFKWYNPNAKKGKNFTKPTKKEYRAMVKGMLLAMLPMIMCVLLAFAIVFLLAFIWLK